MQGLFKVSLGHRTPLALRRSAGLLLAPQNARGSGKNLSTLARREIHGCTHIPQRWGGQQSIARRISSGRALRKEAGDKGKPGAGAKEGEPAAEKATTQNQIHTLYGDIESRILARFTSERSDRFRLYVSATLVGTIVIAVLFGPEMKTIFGQKAVEVAQETLENEKLKQHTSDLAMAVVQTLLNDKDVASNASNFLREACR